MKTIPDTFSADDPGVANGRYFGLPFEADEAGLVILPVPWEVTTSYGTGTACAPQAVMDASLQVDLCDEHYPDGWRRGIGTLEPDRTWAGQSEAMRPDAEAVINFLAGGGEPSDGDICRRLDRVNAASRALNESVYAVAKRRIEAGQTVAVLGGDHSVPLGLIRAVAERHPGVGIVHIDAHADLREAYEGFAYSHASIMYNVLHEAGGVSALVQVGVRDQGEGERALAEADPRITQYTDAALAAAGFRGESWDALCRRIIEPLPRELYISFDIDGLSPELCPHTGTPVPGGLSFQQAVYLIAAIVESGRRIVGFDLCEVSPSPDTADEWDANVGARMLYKLCNLTLLSTKS